MKYTVKTTVETKTTRKAVATLEFDEMVLSESAYLALNKQAWKANTSVNNLAGVKVTTAKYLDNRKIVLRKNGEVVALVNSGYESL